MFYFDSKHIMETTQIIILAAGKGSRMGGDIPKALTPLGNQSMLEHVLDTLESIDNYRKPPIVVVGYKGDMIKDQIGDRAIYTYQDEQLGTGHAVMAAEDLIRPDTDRVLILYADVPFISKETIEALVENKENSPTPLSIATAVIEDENLFRNQFFGFGRIMRDEQANITGIVESRDATIEQKETREVNPAFFCCDRDWMIHCLKSLKNDNAQGEYYLTDLVNMSFEQQHQIHSIQINEKEALGANTPEQLAVLESFIDTK